MIRSSHPDRSVVIVGGGFAGVACAKRLARNGVCVTLVDRHNYNQFQPLLYQLASSQVHSASVARPLRFILSKSESVTFKVGAVERVDPLAKTVTCSDGATFSGDYLVLAMGGEANFFGIPGAREHAFPLYALDDAERLRSRVIAVLEDAYRNPELIDRGALNFVVVGAGATGVEMAGALADVLNRVVPNNVPDGGVDAGRIYVIDPGSSVLAPFSDRAHAYARHALESRGVILDLGVSVQAVQHDRVVLSDGREILTHATIWAGGVQAASLAARCGLPQGAGGRIDVEPDLSVRGFHDVYALGDVANTIGRDGTVLPQLGSVAMQAGTCAADNIMADIAGEVRVPFRYRDKGIMAMIGRNAAIAEVGPKRREFHGALAYASWLGVHASLLSDVRGRATAVASWTWNHFATTRTAALIDRPDAAHVDWTQ